MHTGLTGPERKQLFVCCQCHMLPCCYQHNHGREAAIRIHIAVSIKILEGPSIKLYIFSLVLSNSAEQTSLPHHSLLHLHPMPERNHVFFLPESKTGSDVNAGAGHAQNSLKVKWHNRDAHSLWNSSEVDINKGIIINLKSGKVERILTAAVSGSGWGGIPTDDCALSPMYLAESPSHPGFTELPLGNEEHWTWWPLGALPGWIFYEWTKQHHFHGATLRAEWH